MNAPPNGAVAYSKSPLSIVPGFPWSRPFINQDPTGAGIDLTGFEMSAYFQWSADGQTQMLAAAVELDPATPPTIGKLYASITTQQTLGLADVMPGSITFHLKLTDPLGNVQGAVWPVMVKPS